VSGNGARPTQAVPATIRVSFVVDTRQAGTGQIDASIQVRGGSHLELDREGGGE